MTEDIIVKNYANYKGYLVKILGEEITNNLIESLGGDDAVAKATYSPLYDSGSAYDGSFIKNVIRLTKYATQINDILPEGKKANPDSIYKVGLLSQISKVVLFTENDNQWERSNRGMLYKYTTLDGALRMGERSILLAMNAGVKFDAFEFEAMRIFDKTSDDDNFTKYFSSPLATVIRQAGEIITLVNKPNK